MLGLDPLLGKIFVGKVDQILNDAGILFELLAQQHDLTDDERRTGQRLEDPQLPPLDPSWRSGPRRLASVEEPSHFPQVHADGIVGLFQSTGSQVEMDVGRLPSFELLFGR